MRRGHLFVLDVIIVRSKFPAQIMPSGEHFMRDGEVGGPAHGKARYDNRFAESPLWKVVLSITQVAV